MSPPYVFQLEYTVKELLYYARDGEILISVLRQTIILEKVTVARYKIQPVHLTKKNKDKTHETKVIFFFSSCSPKQLLTDTSVFWIQYLTDKNDLYFSFYMKIRVLMVV